ncbi:MAG: type II toxin-antitoxin system PemK/MazF family toxin [Pyrinomonadaceae bacterium]
MTVKRGEIWLADLNPIRGSEQAGTRPVLILQNNSINRFTSTFLAIPFTTNLRRASLPTCVMIHKGKGGLSSDSIALCHQLRVLDKLRLIRRLGLVSESTPAQLDRCVLFTTGIV